MCLLQYDRVLFEIFIDILAYGFMYKCRKRKVTDDWRNFIRPLSWRLKLTEIRLKQLESQEFKYRRELKKCDMETIHRPKSEEEEEERKSRTQLM